MSMIRKYPKTEGYWLYIIRIPNDMYYVGISRRRYASQRFHPSQYKDTVLQLFIKQFGWQNLEKKIIKDNLTKEQALYWEGVFINMYRKLGIGINKLNSGGEWSKDPLEYYKSYRKIKKEYCSEYNKKYRETHKNELKKRWFKSENKIYNRVNSYNHNHPDKITETPLEAKQKYLTSGYIPTYIKSDDLI